MSVASGHRATASLRAPRPDDPVELSLARSAALLLLVLTGPAVAIAWLAVGLDGALSAAIGAAVVIGMFLMSGAMLSWAARIGPSALLAAALGGYVLRLVIYAGLIVLLRPVEAIHGPSLAISAAALLVIALVWEVRLVTRTPSLFWVDPAAARPPKSVVDTQRASASLTRSDFDQEASERTRP